MPTVSGLVPWLIVLLCPMLLHAAEDSKKDPPSGQRWIWSIGLRLKADDLAYPSAPSLRPMIGLRYGRWRAGPVDGDTWHRFGQIRTDNSLTYDWLDAPQWRTSLSASIINLQKDSPTDALESGRKTLRGKGTTDYLGWSHWSVGLVLTHDLPGRGTGTAVSPSLTYRQAITDDSTILLSQSLTWASQTQLATTHTFDPLASVHAGTGWASADSTLTLRQRWQEHWSWFMQIHRSQALSPFYPGAEREPVAWHAQTGVIYFSR